MRSWDGSDETRAAGEIGGDQAVHVRGEERRGRCDGRQAGGRERESEQRHDRRRGEGVGRHRQQRDGVELQPRDGRGRQAARRRERDHVRERAGHRVAVQDSPQPRRDREDRFHGAGIGSFCRRLSISQRAAGVVKLTGDLDSMVSGLDALSAVEVPLTITGTMSSPTVRPDIESLAKGKLGQEVQQKAGDLVKKKLGDKLKDLFGH